MTKRKQQEGTWLLPSTLSVPEDCRAVSEVLSRVGDKWTILVVSTLGDGPKRFNELRRSLGSISQRMLTLTLRGLERDGLVTRTVLPTIPPRVDYQLTKLDTLYFRQSAVSVCGPAKIGLPFRRQDVGSMSLRTVPSRAT